MRRFVPKEKMNAKARRELDARERGSWNGLNPATKRIESRKLYNRKKARIKYEDTYPGSFAVAYANPLIYN